jgi:putative protease
MRKSGGTVFRVDQVQVRVPESLFVKTSDLNELRRRALAGHLDERQKRYIRPHRGLEVNNIKWLSDRVGYKDNITNSRARDFYRHRGVTFFDIPEDGIAGEADPALMTTRYCVRAQLGLCPSMPGGPEGRAESLILSDQTGRYSLDFDCAVCEMTLRLTTDR